MTKWNGFFKKNILSIAVMAAVFYLVTFLSACNGMARKPSLEQLSEIKEGVTTKEQAIQILGRPDRQYLNRTANELIMSYNSGAFFLLIGPDGRVVRKVLKSGQVV